MIFGHHTLLLDFTMKRLYQAIIPTLVILGLYVSCHPYGVFESHHNVSGGDFSYVRVNTDVSSSELFSSLTENGDTISWHGEKNKDGTTANLTTIEYGTVSGVSTFVDLDDSGRLESIANNLGVTIEFEWQSETSAIIKAHSQRDNVFISTLVDFSEEIVEDDAETKVDASAVNRRVEPLSLKITDNNVHNREMFATRANLDPNDFPLSQEIHLWINQCGSNFNAKNYLILKNAYNGVTIGKLVNSEWIYKGNYIYNLPLSSYPSSATNQELCASIDAVLRKMDKWMSGALVDAAPIVYAINYAAFLTGIGTVPAVISDAIYLGFVAINCGLSVFNTYGGVAGFMQRVDSEWYYKEYIISDLAVIPVGYTQSLTVMGEKYIVSPTDGVCFMTLEMPGEPVINSFILDPSNPGENIGYTATADYHCIPEGSTITLDIIGTDGYTDSKSHEISGSGSAELYVPGAKSGVYDRCTVRIDMPFGETLTTQASLVFGN